MGRPGWNPKRYLKLLRQWILYLFKSKKKTQVKRDKEMMQASNERDWPKTFDEIDEFIHKYYKAMVEDQGIDTLDGLPNERDWPRTFNGIGKFFHKCYGITSIHLAYIIRKDSTPKEKEDTDVDDPLVQMIEGALHTLTEANGTIIKHHTFVTDNKMLFDKFAELPREYECGTYVKPHARARNGRAAYMAFKNHYLGPNNIDNMAATAENKLINATYRGEGRHWDFERYSTFHKEQHTILEGLKEFGYAGMYEGSKARHLLAGIKTTALDSVKTQILCNAELRQDFAKCVVLFMDYIMQTKVNKPKS